MSIPLKELDTWTLEEIEKANAILDMQASHKEAARGYELNKPKDG